ncbi:ATP synthase F0 subcomplex B subunit [Rubellimicrobium thermophilum DSM 16684]|uniref:ATP synthase subunit b n=1 Tax=Rubellimicrobium thermophilum DSM 16684 TaxID=1123069 RepID=S9QZ67_9RHOB|nr:ATP synthase F0 subcomplex B subunit [Rubellimicrobium thermophilum]EPX84907.1 ATP synthase F0 subcomplex B subunit [Rubellimicrobium thermophilum DSM 16684]
MTRLLTPTLILAAAPAAAATGDYGFFSLRNTDFVVLLAFVVFVGILLYFRVPSLIAGMLDRRAEAIRAELAEARALREEAQALLASFDRKRQEMAEQSARIVAQAREEAQRMAAQAREDAERAVARRIASAEEQIAAAEARALRDVRDRAAAIAVAAAQEVLAAQMTDADAARLIDESIDIVAQRLH